VLRILALLGIITSAGLADTVTYTLSATASGSLDGTSFSDSSLIITALANTATPGTPFSSTVVVGSLSDTFNLNLPYVFATSGTCVVSSEFPGVSSCAGFGEDGEDILDISNNGLAGYALGTAIGPLTDATPTVGLGGSFVDDSGGHLVLSSVTNGSFTASVSSVPEPSLAGILCIGLCAIAIAYRRRMAA
jgi:hypothetical protein